MVKRERDSAPVDLESGATTSEDEGNRDYSATGVKQAKKYLGRVWSGILRVDEELIKDEQHPIIGPSITSSTDNGDLFMDKSSGGEEEVALLSNTTLVKEKRRNSGTKKPPKPPRPPGGPSLDAADQKLVREISELAMLKRARIERQKAQKKMKAAKKSSPSSSSTSSVCAMVVTLLFCLIIIFQGMLSREDSSRAIFDGSPESATINGGALISVQYYKNPSSSSTHPSSGSPNLVEQVSGSDPEEERSRVTG